MGTWSPITGIPEPSWGITQEAVALSGLNYDYVGDGGIQEYRIGANGPYTHLIDVSHPSGTNSGNTHGTESIPRTAWPADIRTLPSGSIVEIRGSGTFGGERFEANGTPDLPIYFRGAAGYDGLEPTIWRTWFIQGSYYIFENLKWDFKDNEVSRTAFGIADYDTSASVSNIAIRNCEIMGIDYNGSAGSNQAIVMSHRHTTDPHAGTPSGVPDGTIKNVVIDNCYIHHCGHENVGDNDVSGIFIGCNASGIWVTNNDFWMIGGDAIQLNADNNEAPDFIDPPQYVYVGNNTGHDLYENLLDLKQCHDVVVSRNTAYDIGEGVGVIGKVGRGGAPFRFGIADSSSPEDYRHNVWCIFNEAYNCLCLDGAFLSFNRVDESNKADKIYYIGNLVHDCINPYANSGAHDNWNQDSTAFGFWWQKEIWYVNNTCYNVDQSLSAVGANSGSPEPDDNFHIINNLFGDISNSGYSNRSAYFFGPEESFDRATVRNNLYYQSSGTYIIQERVSSTTDYTWEEYLAHRPEFLVESVNADPLFTDAENDDYTLQANSPAIGAGYDHGLYDLFESTWGMSIKEDFYGNAIDTNNLDIGAYYSGNGTSTTPNLVLGVDNLHLVLHSI